MGKLEDLIFSHSEIANYGQYSADITTTAGDKLTVTLPDLGNKILFLVGWRATGVTTSTCFLSFENVRGWDGQRIELVTANMTRDNKFFPYIICKGNEVRLNIEDTSIAAQVLSLLLDFFTIPNDSVMLDALEKYVGLNTK